jgi:hypothetical protein
MSGRPRTCGPGEAGLRRAALDLKDQVLVILVPATSADEAAQVAVDGFDDTEWDLLLAVGEEGLEVLEECEGDLLEGREPLPAQALDPVVEERIGGPS